ncbi:MULTISPECIES: GntR family transcriptional regulator [unclassified Pseudoalteromonas]|jgi:DNA-binding GntR family transcriptional regulator|uniref:GntR family transcriptional regulator n=1 Tax=unclassified Pseudoalteromonas TaxID=194690 RepID=UPI0009769924|nr:MULTISPECIES: GntR family transcriptional regulator [unclassified Pseudoalteromonas]TMP66832.1 pyruvate dehydrogenase complex transcriptional repressor PdhR [Pseudoalteromonas sp. S1609]
MTQHFLNDTAVTTASDKVFVDMRREIVEGSIAQGSKISEPELAKRYGVSRATLREALNRLESCYLVERKANIGCRVVALTAERLIEVYQVRSALEGLACRLAADNMEPDEVQGLKQLLNQHLHTQRVKEGESYYQEAGDLDFHYRIIKGSKNAHLIHLLCHDLYQLIRMYRVQMGMVGPRVSKAFDEHLAIINAIENHDGELAEMLMKRHISASQANIQTKFDGYQSVQATQNEMAN